MLKDNSNFNNFDIDYDIYDAIKSLNFSYIMNYVYSNYIQLILLVSVFLIIYVVDRINQYNNQIFGLPQIPGIPIPSQQQIVNFSEKNIKKRKKNK